jgi:hypothetical protein
MDIWGRSAGLFPLPVQGLPELSGLPRGTGPQRVVLIFSGAAHHGGEFADITAHWAWAFISSAATDSLTTSFSSISASNAHVVSNIFKGVYAESTRLPL